MYRPQSSILNEGTVIAIALHSLYVATQSTQNLRTSYSPNPTRQPFKPTRPAPSYPPSASLLLSPSLHYRHYTRHTPEMLEMLEASSARRLVALPSERQQDLFHPREVGSARNGRSDRLGFCSCQLVAHSQCVW